MSVRIERITRIGYPIILVLFSPFLGAFAEGPEHGNTKSPFVDFRNTPEGQKFIASTLARYSDGGGVEIPDTCAGSPSAEKIIKIRIKNNFRNIIRTQRIRVRNYKPDTDNGTGTASTPPQPVLGGRMTRLDLDLKPYFGNSEYVRVKVILRDSELNFLNGVVGVKVESGSEASYCGRVYNDAEADDEDGNPKYESISFFVKKNPAYKTPIHFNIHVVVTDTNNPNYSLPIIIDPIIKNDG